MEIGVDIVKVDRIKQAIEKNNSFIYQIFNESEIEYCEGRKNKYECYAARFAAKEAFIKAMKNKGISNWTDINVKKHSAGDLSIEYGLIKAKLSISHEKEYAVAYVVVE